MWKGKSFGRVGGISRPERSVRRRDFVFFVALFTKSIHSRKPIETSRRNTVVPSPRSMRPCAHLSCLACSTTCSSPLLVTWSWIFRFIHIALDTFVLYGVLRERHVDERADGNTTGSGDFSSGRRRSGRGTRNGSGGSNAPTSKHVARVVPV